MPKSFQKDAKMDAQIPYFSYFFEKGENAPDPLFSHIQVAKQVRTVPVRGFGAEEGFDAKECDLRKLCSPAPPHPKSSEYCKML